MNDLRSNTSDSHEVDALQCFVTVCEQFEADWRAGSVPAVGRIPRSRRAAGAAAGCFASCSPSKSSCVCNWAKPPRSKSIRHVTRNGPRPRNWSSRETRRVRFTDSNAAGSDLASVSGPTELEYFPLAASGEQTVTVGSPPIAKPDLPVQPIPESFGRYTVVSLLGRGGFGTVYLARDGELGRLVAIKVPRPGLLSSPEQVQAFLDEARIAAGLVHPAIVAVYDVGRQGENGVFVVFEYVEGRNLAKVLKAERLSPTQLVKLMVPVAEAAHHAHRAGLVHRDMKPSNILIDQQGRPHIADFGLASSEDLQEPRAAKSPGRRSTWLPNRCAVRRTASTVEPTSGHWA